MALANKGKMLYSVLNSIWEEQICHSKDFRTFSRITIRE